MKYSPPKDDILIVNLWIFALIGWDLGLWRRQVEDDPIEIWPPAHILGQPGMMMLVMIVIILMTSPWHKWRDWREGWREQGGKRSQWGSGRPGRGCRGHLVVILIILTIMHTISIMMMLMCMRSKDQGGLALGCRGYLDMIVMMNILRGNNSQCRFKKPNCIVK